MERTNHPSTSSQVCISPPSTDLYAYHAAGEQTTVSGSSLKFKSPKLRRGAEIQNLGSTIQIFVDGSATIGKKVHNLKQFHFHTPSEHHLDNEYFPAEVHFVFQSDGTLLAYLSEHISLTVSADEALAVVGFFIEIAAGSDQTSPLLEAALRNVASIPNAGDKGRTAGLDFSNIKTHLSGSDVFQYSGSLTTPPCKEGVTFNIVASPLYVSAATFRATKDILKFNSRYTQNKPGQINLLDNVRIDIDT